MTVNPKELPGYLFAIITSVCWSSAFIIAKYLLTQPPCIDPVTLVFCRYLIGALFIFTTAAARGHDLRPGPPKRFMLTALTAFLLYWLMALFFFFGQTKVSATTASLFVESGPALLLISGKIIMRKRVTRRETTACMLGITGCMAVLNLITPEGFGINGSWSGIVLVLLSALSWTVGGVFGQKLMRNGDRMTAVGWCELLCAVYSLPLMLIMRDSIIFSFSTATQYIAVLAMGILPTGIAFVTWGEAMVRLPLWKLNLMQNLTPVFTLFGAALLINEPVTTWNLTGVLAVTAGLMLAASGKDASDNGERR